MLLALRIYLLHVLRGMRSRGGNPRFGALWVPGVTPSVPLILQLRAMLGELASVRWGKAAYARRGGEPTPDPPAQLSCEASVAAPCSGGGAAFTSTQGQQEGCWPGLAMPKLVFFLPCHTALGTPVSRGSLFLTPTSV